MATNLDIDPKLLQRALEVSDERTKTAVVSRALEEYVARRPTSATTAGGPVSRLEQSTRSWRNSARGTISSC